ncbi:hypothetical protein L6452_35033 [Arctium lappa]|uniref:Uncharacterized protein n=1 Tax=Arctium lappa TaxID=4217 RepID=A0ACB8YJW4_ARCLA|nr:hypothetical protein L6452_35033 [Arctium lappa]
MRVILGELKCIPHTNRSLLLTSITHFQTLPPSALRSIVDHRSRVLLNALQLSIQAATPSKMMSQFNVSRPFSQVDWKIRLGFFSGFKSPTPSPGGPEDTIGFLLRFQVTNTITRSMNFHLAK